MRPRMKTVLLALSAVVPAIIAISALGVSAQTNPADPSPRTIRGKGIFLDDGLLVQETQANAQTQEKKKDQMNEETEWVKQNMGFLKKYTLKYINASDFINGIKIYGFVGTSSGNTVSVYLSKATTPQFEELLKKLDVEKKSIRFQFFPVIAYRERPNRKEALPEGTARIPNKELRTVLDEIVKLWNFRYFETDFPSFLTVREGADSNSFQLVSKLASFNLTVVQPQIRGDKVGERNIYIRQIRLTMTSNSVTLTPIDSQDISFRENGYLVVGVGGGGYSGVDAVILVVSAEINRAVPSPTVMPCYGLVSILFGERTDPRTGKKNPNNGINILNEAGTEIKAIWDGEVISIDNELNSGKKIRLHHSLGYETVYSPLGKVRIKKGSLIKAGDILGVMENSGSPSGPHLHIEILQNGEPQNPLEYLKDLRK